MALRPTLMNGADLDEAKDAARFLLGLDERCGVIGTSTRKELETLLDECVIEQTYRKDLAASKRITPTLGQLVEDAAQA